MEQNQNIEKNKYHNGKIYTIRSHKTDMFYIGSTVQPISKRFSEHKIERNTTSKIIFDFGDAYYELLENFKCENKDQLNKREGELIRLNKDKCVNINIPCRPRKEWVIEYREKNKEIIAEKKKIYDKEYSEKNKEKISKQKKEYHEKKKIQLSEKNSNP